MLHQKKEIWICTQTMSRYPDINLGIHQDFYRMQSEWISASIIRPRSGSRPDCTPICGNITLHKYLFVTTLAVEKKSSLQAIYSIVEKIQYFIVKIEESGHFNSDSIHTCLR